MNIPQKSGEGEWSLIGAGAPIYNARTGKLCAAYRQATRGDAAAAGGSRPWAFNMSKRADWNAWKALEGKSGERAAEIFLEEARLQVAAGVWSEKYIELLALPTTVPSEGSHYGPIHSEGS